MTPAAAARVRVIVASEPPGSTLRISVKGGGCSGFSYAFEIGSEQPGEDIVVSRDGARVLIDPVSIGYMTGSTIDFVDDLMGQAFKIHNPMATSGCGCGTSFSL
jgi:iron-sulfur cluster assembly accessory protein